MLELAFIIIFSKRIARIAREKNRSSVGYIALFVVVWIFGEAAGAIFGRTLANFLNRGDSQLLLICVLGFALAGVSAATLLSFWLVKQARPVGAGSSDHPDLPKDQQYWNPDDHRKPDDRYEKLH
jgi:hypothetical protein